jgi:hypothetical protein
MFWLPRCDHQQNPSLMGRAQVFDLPAFQATALSMVRKGGKPEQAGFKFKIVAQRQFARITLASVSEGVF